MIPLFASAMTRFSHLASIAVLTLGLSGLSSPASTPQNPAPEQTPETADPAQTPRSFPRMGIYAIEAIEPDADLTAALRTPSAPSERLDQLVAACLSAPVMISEDHGFVWLRLPRNTSGGFRAAQRWNCAADPVEGDEAAPPPDDAPIFLRCPLAPSFHNRQLPVPIALLSFGPDEHDSFALQYTNVTLIHHPCAQTHQRGVLETPANLPDGVDLIDTLAAMHRAAQR